MDGSARTTAPARTPGTWRAGRLAGAPVEVRPSSLVTLVLLILALWRILDAAHPARSSAALGASVVAGVLVAASVVAHELAHAVAARRVGVRVERVVVTTWGARVQLDAEAFGPRTTALVAAAGPATSLLLAMPALLVPIGLVDGVVGSALAAVGVVNAATGVLNLLPALPLDGGKLLAAGLGATTGDRERGAVVAARAGHVLAVLVVLGVAVRAALAGRAPEPFEVVLAVLAAGFLWAGASAALRSARSAAAVARLDLRLLLAPAVGLPATDTLADATAFAPDGLRGTGVVALATDGRPVGWVDPAAADAVPPSARGATPLAAVLRPLDPHAVVPADVTGAEAVRRVAAGAAHSPVLVVVDRAGEVLGLLRAQDVVAALRAPGREGGGRAGGTGPDA